MQAVLGEGPTWLEEQERLAFVDIEGKRIHIWDPVSNGLESISTEAVGRPSTLSPSREGNFLVVAIEQAVYLVDIQKKTVGPCRDVILHGTAGRLFMHVETGRTGGMKMRRRSMQTEVEVHYPWTTSMKALHWSVISPC